MVMFQVLQVLFLESGLESGGLGKFLSNCGSNIGCFEVGKSKSCIKIPLKNLKRCSFTILSGRDFRKGFGLGSVKIFSSNCA